MQQFAESFPGPEDPGFDATLRAAEGSGDRSVVQSFEFVHAKGFTLLRPQDIDGRKDGLVQLSSLHTPIGAVGAGQSVERPVTVDESIRIRCSTSIDPVIQCQAIKPCGQTRIAPESVEMSVDL